MPCIPEQQWHSRNLLALYALALAPLYDDADAERAADRGGAEPPAASRQPLAGACDDVARSWMRDLLGVTPRVLRDHTRASVLWDRVAQQEAEGRCGTGNPAVDDRSSDAAAFALTVLVRWEQAQPLAECWATSKGVAIESSRHRSWHAPWAPAWWTRLPTPGPKTDASAAPRQSAAPHGGHLTRGTHRDTVPAQRTCVPLQHADRAEWTAESVTPG